MTSPKVGDIIPLTASNGTELGDLEIIKVTIVVDGLLLDCKIVSLTDAVGAGVELGSVIKVPIKLAYRE